jgi:hypothetical protein
MALTIDLVPLKIAFASEKSSKQRSQLFLNLSQYFSWLRRSSLPLNNHFCNVADLFDVMPIIFDVLPISLSQS